MLLMILLLPNYDKDGCKEGDEGGRKTGNALFNDVFNTYLFTVIWRRTCGKGPHRTLAVATTWVTLFDLQQGFFYMHHSTDMITHTTAFVTQVVEHWLEQDII